jgi:cob(I)alamin adenosyltransferase
MVMMIIKCPITRKLARRIERLIMALQQNELAGEQTAR